MTVQQACAFPLIKTELECFSALSYHMFTIMALRVAGSLHCVHECFQQRHLIHTSYITPS